MLPLEGESVGFVRPCTPPPPMESPPQVQVSDHPRSTHGRWFGKDNVLVVGSTVPFDYTTVRSHSPMIVPSFAHEYDGVHGGGGDEHLAAAESMSGFMNCASAGSDVR